MDVNGWIHWYMVAFFALFGLFLIVFHSAFGDIRAFFRGVCGGDADAKRLARAVERRRELERFPGSQIGLGLGIASLCCAALGAFLPAPPTMLYALLCLALAGALGASYVSLRRAGGPRVASLRYRDPNTVVPSYVYVLTAASSVSALSFIDKAPVGALLVTSAAVIIAAIGRGTAALPALLSGEDVAVERYVDDRLRALRTVSLLGTATAPPFVFATFSNYADSAAHVVTVVVSFAGLMVSLAWQFTLTRRRPTAADRAGWSEAGA
jgi:hypothetical protein